MRVAIVKNKWFRYIIKVFIVFISAWLLLLAVTYVYIRINKEKIVANVQNALNEKLSGKISFDDLSLDLLENFPGVSIDVENVHIQDSLYSQHAKELLNVKHAYISYSLIDLLAGNRTPKRLTLKDGTIYLFKDTSGHKNWGIFKVQGKKKSEMEELTLKNITTIYQDDTKFKFFHFLFKNLECDLNNRKEDVKLKINFNSLVTKACFNTVKGSYLTGKKFQGDIVLVYDKVSEKLNLQDQKIRIGNHPYNITANFFLADSPRFEMNFKTTNLALKEAASNFPPKAAQSMSAFTLSQPLQNVEGSLSGPMKYKSIPFVKVTFEVNNASIVLPTTSITDCSFKGLFKNEFDSTKIRDDHNSYMQFSALKAKWEKNAFESKNVYVYDFIEPFIRLDIHTKFDLVQLEKAIASPKIDFNSGKGEATLAYAGPLKGKNDSAFDLNGTISITNADIGYNPRNLQFNNTSIECSMQNGNLQVKKMNTTLNGNSININGNINSFMTFFNTDPSKAIIHWNVSSPHIDVSKLKSSLRRSSAAKKKDVSTSIFKNLNNKIDRFFDECNAYVHIQAEKLSYLNFTATNVKGSLALTNDMVKLDNFSLSHAGGSMHLNASTRDNGNYSNVALQAKLQNVDVKELFRAFNNFGMQALTSQNLQGSFNADINLNTMLDANHDIHRLSNRGFVDFSLKNGRLVNFTPLMQVDNNFLKKRNMSDIRFAELKDRLVLNGNDVTVPRMEIRSSAISMFVEGNYSFTTNTNLTIQVPLKGLKKQDEDYVPTNEGVDAKTGMSIFLRAKDDNNGKLKIAYEPFARFKKKDKENK